MARKVCAAALILTVSGLAPSGASACVLNSQSSLSANGHTATKNFGGSSASGVPIPFLFSRVYGRGQGIRFAENMNDLRKSLSARALSHPFLWRWGDGTDSVGWTPSHVYRRNGTYIVSVYAYEPPQGGAAWSPFDKSQIQIVPPGAVWRDNLGQDLLDILNISVTWGIRAILAAVGMLLSWGIWRDRQWNRRKRLAVARGMERSGASPQRVGT